VGLAQNMKATEILVLPPDVLITPVERLESDLRNRLCCGSGDYLVSRPRARSRSLVVEPAAAAFLEQFRSPKTVVQAVINYGREQRIGLEQVLDDAVTLVTRMRRLRLLVVDGSLGAEEITPTLTCNTCIVHYRILSCVQILEDVEVYKVTDTSGCTFAFKILRQDAREKSRRMLEREAAVLRLLSGRYSPSLIANGAFENRMYIVTEWRRESDVMNKARELRSPLGPRRSRELVELCLCILRAYSWLHEFGLVHGDVHPTNILTGEDGKVILLDFGLACCVDCRYDLPPFGRGGVAEYMEPEYCRALERQERPPAATPASEQYALAALCYLLLTGSHHLDFSLDRERWLTQVLREPPRPFFMCGLPSWPAVERTLAKALSKEPLERFESVSKFADDLAQAAGHEKPDEYQHSTSQGLLKNVLQRFGRSGPRIRSDFVDDPKCSVNYGASGLAYFFYRLACLRNDADMLATADIWSSWSRENATRSDAFYSSEIRITQDTVGPLSLYHSETGMHCVQALISQAMGDLYSANKAAHAFVAASNRPSTNLDLTLGHSGLLIGCAALLEALPEHVFLNRSPLRELGKRTLANVWGRLLNETVHASEAVPWLGIAHGWAGILYATLRWREAARTEVAGLVERLYELADVGMWRGSTVAWPLRSARHLHDRSPRIGWCHGSAGYVHLWTLAHRNFGDQRFIRLAEGAANHIWESLDATSPVNGSLCCGYAGQGYALLSLYRQTGDAIWLRRAAVLAERAAVLAHRAERRASLFKGDIGIALLIEELTQPELSCTPLFEAEGWPPRA
jgi:serine/threonine-protein kinase